MKKLLFTAALLCLTQAVSAADLVLKAPMVQAASASSGIYVGINGGGAITKDNIDFVSIPGSGTLHPAGCFASGLYCRQ